MHQNQTDEEAEGKSAIARNNIALKFSNAFEYFCLVSEIQAYYI